MVKMQKEDVMRKLEECARAIHASAEELGEGGYVGDFNFSAGLTTLDGEFDLNEFARAVIRCLMEQGKAVLEAGAIQTDVDAVLAGDVFRAMLQSVLDETDKP